MKFEEKRKQLVDEKQKLINDLNQIQEIMKRTEVRIIEVSALIREYDLIIEDNKKTCCTGESADKSTK